MNATSLSAIPKSRKHADAYYGRAVGITEDMVIVGSDGWGATLEEANTGRAYVYRRECNCLLPPPLILRCKNDLCLQQNARK
eukprot:SAG11_NODE_53_length_19648_cov_14.691902_23_plen_82_part_00